MKRLGTKSETLEFLENKIKTAVVLPQFRLSVSQWNMSKSDCINNILKKTWAQEYLIVRSSSLDEDKTSKSLAGKYLSIPGIKGADELYNAIEKVIYSYDTTYGNNQVFIQPMLKNVLLSGVGFSLDPNTGGNYIVINYDDKSGSTSSVTSGNSINLKTYYFFKNYTNIPKNALLPVVQLIKELENILNSDSLDIEFAIDQNKQIYLLQVRELVLHTEKANIFIQKDLLSNISKKIRLSNKSKPYLYGEKTVFGVMPDWNPAEIIGVKPKPLALTLYKDLITDSIWAYQRDNYGYKNLRGFPLMVDLCGLPYIDVRVSFNSFIPKELNDSISNKLVNYYINKLITSPSMHDKVEFDIIFSCYTLDLSERIKTLENNGFSELETQKILNSLKTLTNTIIDVENGLWKLDTKKIDELDKRRKTVLNSKMDKISKIYWLLEDCKRYGTLPFAGLARAGFIAVQMLKSLINIGVITNSEYQNFLGELKTISSQMSSDLSYLSQSAFLDNYGHLRPGTYDILSPRYDENPDLYFDWSNNENKNIVEKDKFVLSINQLKEIQNLLNSHGLTHDVLSMFDFIKYAIEGREYSKFIFTKSLSEALKLYSELAVENGFSLEEASYSDIEIIKKLYSSDIEYKKIMRKSISDGKEKYNFSKQITLPPLIVNQPDIWSFHQPEFSPNYITQKSAKGHICFINEPRGQFKDCILLIENADPGYDWIFTHGISGFITMYGGVNSHMAIRSGELGIPSVIGVGEKIFNKLTKSKIVEINCLERRLHILK